MSSIRMRLLVIILSLMIASLGVLAGLSYYFSKQALIKSVDETAAAIGTDYASRIQASANELIIPLQDLASIQRLRSASDREQIVEALAEAHKRLGSFDVVNFIYPDGATLRHDGSTAYLGDRDYFKQVVQTKKQAVSDPLVVRSTGKLSVNIAVPVLDNGVLKGVVTGTVSLDRMGELVKGIKFKETGYGAIFDDSGLLLAHGQKPDMVGKLNLREKKINPELKLETTELDDNLMASFKAAAETGKQVRGVYSFAGSDPIVSLFTPIGLPGGQRWVVAVSAPEAETTREVRTLTMIMLAVALTCVVLGAIIVLFISSRFAQPIVKLRDEALLLAEGDLRNRGTVIAARDEIGQLAQAFAQMAERLRGLVAKVHSQAEQVAAASEQLTASADQTARAANQVAGVITEVADGATKQLKAIDDTATVVGQMSAGIQQIAANAQTVAGTSAKSAAAADEGGRAVQKAVVQISHVEETVVKSAQVVSKLGDRSKEIGQIVDTISGIAGQTNLLALNAAIEAARAGEQGRGFAVVADEVRKLAEQSQEAAKQIAVLIAEIQQDTDSAVAAMGEGTKEVRVGAEVVNQAGKTFSEIYTLFEGVSIQIREISAAIQQMAGGSQVIVSSVRDIDAVSKETSGQAQTVSAATEEQSATMEEIAVSTQALAKMATELTQAVSIFKI